MSMSLLLGWGGLIPGKKITLETLCTKKVGGAYVRGGAYLHDTTVLPCSPSIVEGQSSTLCRALWNKCEHTVLER